jgi:tRNA pseudouridine38-40 synthase
VAGFAKHGALAVERLKLLVAYDGRPFTGWQSQARRNGVQDHLESALAKITGTDIRVHGSGRTDAGVHALGQVAHIDVSANQYAPATWLAALNANLPAEIRILRVQAVPGGREGFHARYSASGKRYDYRIWNETWLHPMEIGRVWHVPNPVDLALLREGAELLIGRHDFAGFAANRGKEVPDTVRTITELKVARRGPLITLHVTGTGFLYKMVRLLTGTLVRVGQGKVPVECITELLASKGRKKTQFAAPAEGLYLARVFYGAETGDEESSAPA